jgi:hypothetical protein
MLFRDDVRIEIMREPQSFPSADYEGLVVRRDQMPPLLHPRMLMDLEGYAAWERHMVARCADPRCDPESVLATLRRDARVLRQWKPNGQTLAQTVGTLPPDRVETTAPQTLDESLHFYGQVIAAVPDDMKPAPDEEGLESAFQSYVRPKLEEYALPLKRYLATKAFASWTAYQGRGIATIVRGLEAALALVRVEASRQCRNRARMLDPDLLREAFRSADFMLNHLAVSEDLAHCWSAAEQGV